MTEIMRDRTRDLCGPMLRPCEGCGGTADYARAAEPGYVVERCTGCGRQTGPRVTADNAARDWNRRITTGARVVTLAELRALDFNMGDDSDAVAVWIETREGELRAAVLMFGIDLGDPTVHERAAVVACREDGEEHIAGYLGGPVREYREAAESRWTEAEIAAEGIGWRLWDKKPTQADRDAEPWDRPIWKDARILAAEAMVAEVMGERQATDKQE